MRPLVAPKTAIFLRSGATNRERGHRFRLNLGVILVPRPFKDIKSVTNSAGDSSFGLQPKSNSQSQRVREASQVFWSSMQPWKLEKAHL